MALPTSYTAFRRTTGDLPRTIEQAKESLPQDLGPNDVLIKIRAVSLNYRDVGMLIGNYPAQVEDQGIPCSDCAAEVVAVGSAVGDFRVGDRVSPIFDLSNLTGTESTPMKALGGDQPGVLREYAVFEDRFLVHLPEYLTWEEVGTDSRKCSP
jgi:NADPH:quinone reductase-like Zn-dependent oxidoreductase